MKKILAMFMVCLMIIGCVGCGNEGNNGGNEGEAKAATGKKVGILVVTSGSQWCNSIIQEVTKVVEENGGEVIVSDSQVSVDNELSGMENLISSGCDAIVVNAMNPAGLSDLCKQAQEKGIYIIGWSDLLENYDVIVQEDPAQEAEMIAGAISDFVGDEDAVEMAVIWLSDAQNPDTTTGIFKEALEAEFKTSLVEGKGMKLVNEQYAPDSTKAMEVAEAIITANPNVKVIFCQNDEMGVAVSQILQGKGYGPEDIMVCGLDGTEEALNMIAGGSSCLSNTVFSDTKAVGRKVGESICQYFEDGSKTEVAAEYVLVGTDNAADYVTQ